MTDLLLNHKKETKMKTLERIPFLANVLVVACERPNNEVGKLVKAVVAYATDGTRPEFDDVRLETYFDLLAHDLDSLRTAAEIKSRKCSESAKCRNNKSKNSNGSPAKKANAENDSAPANAAKLANEAKAADAKELTSASHPANASTAGKDADVSNAEKAPESENADVTMQSGNFDASDATSSFEQMKNTYGKTGDNASQAFDVWKRLNEQERTAAFAYAQRLQSDLSRRSYLFVCLRDREWTKVASPVAPK